MTTPITLHATVSAVTEGVYTVQVADGTNTTDHSIAASSGHHAAGMALDAHKQTHPPAGTPDVAITINGGVV